MKKQGNSSLQEKDIVMQILCLNKTLRADFDKRMEAYDLTGQQARCLLFISGHHAAGNEVHQNDLEKRFELSKSTVSGLIERLEKKKLITKVNSAQFSILVPTEKGTGIIGEIHKNHIKMLGKLLNGFSEKDKRQIQEYIDKLISNMKED